MSKQGPAQRFLRDWLHLEHGIGKWKPKGAVENNGGFGIEQLKGSWSVIGTENGRSARYLTREPGK